MYFPETKTASPLDIKVCLAEQVHRYQYIGHPALLERFVLRNGHPGVSQPRPKGVRKRAYKQCFRNSIQFYWNGADETHSYVEGFAISEHGFMVHHAWLEDERHNVLDLTWKDPLIALYYGVTFTREEVKAQIIKHKVYGFLDHGFDGLNAEFMFGRDPELRDICDKVNEARLAKQSPIFQHGAGA